MNRVTMSMITDICTMYILLVAATSFEIQPTMDQLPAGHEIDVLLTGIGAVPTTWSLMRQIGRRRPDCIIQAGIAGSFIPHRIGEVIVINEDTFGDVGVHEDGIFRSVFDLNLIDEDQPPFTHRLLVNPYTKWMDSTGLRQVRAITVNEISTNPERIASYQQNISPVVESMEGAALHYVGLQENIPFLQIRSVSNDIAQRDKSKWDFKSAIHALNGHLAYLVQRLSPDIITK